VSALTITRAGPLATLQDAGRFGMLAHGISASGPMDRGAFAAAGAQLERAGATGIEITAAGLAFRAEGPLHLGCAGGTFGLSVNGKARDWPGRLALEAGDVVEVTPGPAGNYGYLRFDREIEVPPLLGSRATNLTVGLGGFKGRALRATASPSAARARRPWLQMRWRARGRSACCGGCMPSCSTPRCALPLPAAGSRFRPVSTAWACGWPTPTACSARSGG